MSVIKTWWETFKSYIPWWLSNRAAPAGSPKGTGPRNVGYRILWSMILPLDTMQQAGLEGTRAQFPGIGTPTANYLIAQSRGLIQGETESEAAWGARAVHWLDGWTQTGMHPGEWLARNIQAFLGNTPAVTVVDRAGQWVVLSSAGVVTFTTAPWDWDSKSNPERAGQWSDVWIIVYPCEWTQADTFENRKKSPRGAGDGFGVVGGQALRHASDAIRQLCATMRDGHTTLRAIVFSYDTTLCLPGGSNNPDGNWGFWGKMSGGVRVAARSANARYMIPLDV